MTETDKGMERRYDNVCDMGEPGLMRWFKLVPSSATPPLQVSIPTQAQLLDVGMRHQQARMQLELRRGNAVPYSAADGPPHAASWGSGGLQLPMPPASWRASDEPPTPETFDTKPALPAVDFLRTVHHHDRDSEILFFDETHTYYVGGERTMGSVTGMVHLYCQPFVARDVIQKMRKGRNWPRVEYLTPSVSPWVVEYIAAVPGCEMLADALGDTDPDKARIVPLVRRAKCHRLLPDDVLEYLSMTDDEIIAMWDKNCTQVCVLASHTRPVSDVAKIIIQSRFGVS